MSLSHIFYLMWHCTEVKEVLVVTDKMYAAKLRSQRRKDTMYKRKKKKEDSMYRYYSRSKYRIGKDYRHERRVYNLESKIWVSPDATKLMNDALNDYYDIVAETAENMERSKAICEEFNMVYDGLLNAAIKYSGDAYIMREFKNTREGFDEEADTNNMDGMLYYLSYLEMDVYKQVRQLYSRRLLDFNSAWRRVPTDMFRYDDLLREYY